MIVQNTVIVIWGNHAQPFPSFFGGTRADAIHLGGIGFFPEEIFIILASLVVMVCFFFLLRRTMVGKAFSAVAYNPDTASILGINVIWMKVLAYIIPLCWLASVVSFSDLLPRSNLLWVSS